MAFCVWQAGADFVQDVLAAIFCAHPLTALCINTEIQRKMKTVGFGKLDYATNTLLKAADVFAGNKSRLHRQ
ncbi:hypothetical protein D3C76_1683120 [compost metagenome]